MTSRHPFHQLDVFTATPLKGNPLAVVHAAHSLDDEQMAAFARWTNLSETTFLLPPTDPQADYRVRIFTPGAELPFAGHPTLGSCHAWLAGGGVPQRPDIIVQECAIGLVQVRRTGTRLAFAAPPLLRTGPLEPAVLAQVLPALGLQAGDVEAHGWIDNGPGWCVLLLRSADRVLAVRPDFAALGDFRLGLAGPLPAGSDADFEVRAFVPALGIPEDPVTGSFNAGLAQWLIGSGRAPDRYTASQGTALGRSGRVYLERDGATIWVGGEVAGCISGTVDFASTDIQAGAATPAHVAPTLQIVVPCYNEEAVLAESCSQFDQLLGKLVAAGKVAPSSQIVFVDDGSRDKTWALIELESTRRPRVAGLKLSRNRGHQNAVIAGLMWSSADVVVTIDADLQDDIGVIETMVDNYLNGYDVVYGVRNDRSSDSAFKRGSAHFFYALLARFGVELIHNHADFRLMSRRIVDALREYKEVNLYLRGIVPTIGYQATTVEYARKERFAGETKYPLNKMLRLAAEAITSFSTVPLQMITMLGFLVFGCSLVVVGWVIWVTLIARTAIPGWASTVLPLTLLGGIQLLCLGVLGAYLGKVYGEVKSRPRYFIERTVSSTTARPATHTGPHQQ
jgi:PhzF family phenazine biosynthesis protein